MGGHRGEEDSGEKIMSVTVQMLLCTVTYIYGMSHII